MGRPAQLTGSLLLSAGLAAAAVAPLTAAHAAGQATQRTKIATVHTGLGRVVSSSKGRVMFRFLNDARNHSHCSASCQSIWPPVMSDGRPRAGAHLHSSHLGRTKSGQVTYYGHPLYYYVGDPHPGKTTGDGIEEFGAHWYVVSPGGRSVKPNHKSGPGEGTKSPGGPAQVSTGTVDAATVLTDGADGRTLYELSSESGAPASFSCTGSCLSTWHPLLTDGAPTAAGSADSADLATVSRRIAGHSYAQVTYNNHPLYTYAGDRAAGVGNGEEMYDPPGYWYELGPNGQARL